MTGGMERLFAGLDPSTTGALPSAKSLVAKVIAAIGLAFCVNTRDILDPSSPYYNLGKIVRELKGGELN